MSFLMRMGITITTMEVLVSKSILPIGIVMLPLCSLMLIQFFGLIVHIIKSFKIYIVFKVLELLVV